MDVPMKAKLLRVGAAQKYALTLLSMRDEIGGKELREDILRAGYRVRGSVEFYMMMTRLEELGLVTHFDKPQLIDGEKVTLRHFRITEQGKQHAD